MATIKYDKETTDRLIEDYTVKKLSAEEIARALDVSPRSVIAKLSNLGIYEKKRYLTKRGEVPIKKQEYVERIAALLEVNQEILESLEKVNKNVLALLVQALDVEKSDLPGDGSDLG